MGRLWGVVGAVALVLCGFAPAAGASAKPPKVALVYGDSLVWESNRAMIAAFGHGWLMVDRSVPGTGPCQWLAGLPADLAARHPRVVTLATAGNTGVACETAPLGSAQFLADYAAALTTFVIDVTAADAQMVFVEDPPFLDPARNAAGLQIDAIMETLASQYHGVTVNTKARTKMSDKGAYESYAKCLKGETLAMGCVDGQIAIRTLTGPTAGLHLCPVPGIDEYGDCPIYSSGEVRFGGAIADAAKHPKPVLP